MIEDKTHLAVFDGHIREVMDVIVSHNRMAEGKEDKAELLAIRRAQNAALIALCNEHKRALDYMAGEKIEPQTHFGEAVLLPSVGGAGG